MSIDIPLALADTDLLAEAQRLARCERDMTGRLVAHLAEIDRRRLHLAAGHPSLFAYCTEALRLAEHAAYRRIEAARTARRFPLILDMLAEGSLNLATVCLLAPRLTDDNCDGLLADASGKSKRAVEELLARHFPRPDVPASVRKLPASVSRPAPVAMAGALPATGGSGLTTESSGGSAASLDATRAPSHAAVALPAVPPSPATRRPAVTPLAPDRYQFTFTGNRETREMLDLAKDMLRHAIPSGDAGEVMNRALAALLEALARQKFAATTRPRSSRCEVQDAGYVPAQVKREVWIRDRGRCTFMGPSGRRCDTRGFLEFHHVIARARGGPGTAANIVLLCAAHNGYEAEREFGGRRPGGEWAVQESRAVYGRASHSPRDELRYARLRSHSSFASVAFSTRGHTIWWPRPGPSGTAMRPSGETVTGGSTRSSAK
jgi:hypothetical protein